MGTYSTCETWLKLGFDCLLMGFILETIAMSSDFARSPDDTLVVAMEITACVTYVTTVYLVVQVVFLVELEDSVVARVVVALLSFVSCGFSVAGIVIQRVRYPSQALHPYVTTLLAIAAALALVGGIFIILDVSGVKVPNSSCCNSRATTSVGSESPLRPEESTKQYGGTS